MTDTPEGKSIPELIQTTLGFTISDGVVEPITLKTDPLSGDPMRVFGPRWLRVDGETMQSIIAALEGIAKPKYGLQGILEEDGPEADANMANYFSSLAHDYATKARTALKTLESIGVIQKKNTNTNESTK